MRSMDDALNPTPEPPKIKLVAWIAASIEAGIVITFFANGSIFGIVLCVAYAYFSATRFILTRK